MGEKKKNVNQRIGLGHNEKEKAFIGAKRIAIQEAQNQVATQIELKRTKAGFIKNH